MARSLDGIGYLHCQCNICDTGMADDHIELPNSDCGRNERQRRLAFMSRSWGYRNPSGLTRKELPVTHVIIRDNDGRR
jgi:hypothetical protein